MNIGGFNSQLATSGVLKFSRFAQGESVPSSAGETPAASSPAKDTSPVASAIISQALTTTGSLNMFAPTIGIEGGHSKYTQATLNSFSVAGKVANSMRSSMMDMLQNYGGMSISGTYYGPASEDFDKYGIAKKMKTQQSQEIWENSEKMLEEAIEEIEQNAEDAAMPRDEQGNPIPTDEKGNPLYDKDGNPLVATESGEPLGNTQSTKPAAPKIEVPTVNAADVVVADGSIAGESAPQMEAAAVPTVQVHSVQSAKGTEIDLVV